MIRLAASGSCSALRTPCLTIWPTKEQAFQAFPGGLSTMRNETKSNGRPSSIAMIRLAASRLFGLASALPDNLAD